MQSNKSLYLVAAFLPHYRAPIYSLLNSKYSCTWVTCRNYKYAKSIKKIESTSGWNILEYLTLNFWKIGYNIGWYRYVFVENLILIPLPNNVSDWLLILARKLMNRSTTIWTQGPNYSDGNIKIIYKTLFVALADNIFTYNNYSKDIYSSYLKSKDIQVIYNSLSGKVAQKQKGKDLLYSGRLLADRNLEFIIDYLAKYPERSLHIVGDGDYRSLLEMKAKNTQANILFYGEVYDLPVDIYKKCGYGIVPGHSGLNILMYIENGLVPITHNKSSLHMPEFEILESVSAHVLYEYNSVDSLNKTLTSLDSDKELCEGVFESLKFEIESKWNPRNQLKIVEKYT